MNLISSKNSTCPVKVQWQKNAKPPKNALRHSLKWFLCLLLVSLLLPLECTAAKIAIIYPDVSAPYKAVFETILEGIQSQNSHDYKIYPLQKDYDSEQLKAELRNDQANALIALGKRGYVAANSLDGILPTVAGALPLIPNGVTGISLSADPEQIFSRLKRMVPDSQRVFVVYSPNLNGWLMPLAAEAAQKNGLELHSFPAKNLREAMQQYQRLLKTARGRRDAIWLPLDHVTANEEIVLPMLLQEAWDKDLVLCSSKPNHVERGALFALYADYLGLGQELAKLAEQRLQSSQSPMIIPLKRLQVAVNTRTAAHLGLNFNLQQQAFNMVFPAR